MTVVTNKCSLWMSELNQVTVLYNPVLYNPVNLRQCVTDYVKEKNHPVTQNIVCHLCDATFKCVMHVTEIFLCGQQKLHVTRNHPKRRHSIRNSRIFSPICDVCYQKLIDTSSTLPCPKNLTLLNNQERLPFPKEITNLIAEYSFHRDIIYIPRPPIPRPPTSKGA